MTYLGIDFESKKIGLAISDGGWPSPLPSLTYETEEAVLGRIVKFCEENGVERIILGVPVPDEIGARKFGEKLAELTHADIVYIDKTKTTKMTEEELKDQSKKAKVKEDALAASKLLGDYLECC